MEPSGPSRPTSLYSQASTSSCCPIDESKREIRGMMDSFIDDIKRVRDTLSNEPAATQASQPGAAPPARSGSTFDASVGMTQPAPGAYADQATGSAPPAEEYVHKGIWCDSCNKKVVGIRHKCLDCYNFDLCNPCITTSDVQSTHADMPHTFEAIYPPKPKTPVPAPTTVRSGTQPPVASDSQTGQQCLCSVLPRPLGCYICNPRGMTSANPARSVSYKCDSCQTTINSTRHKCMACPDFDLCDSCYTDGFAVADHSLVHMFMHIEDPIRVITAPAVRHEPVESLCAGCSHEGPRYKCDSCGAVDLCMNCLGEVERATVSHAAFHVEQGWSQPVRLVPYHSAPNPAAPAATRTSSTRSSVVHSAECDACDSTIVGTRHKCTVCHDFDLCDSCYQARAEVIEHKADHEMLHLELPTRVVTHIVPPAGNGSSSARPSPLGSGSPTAVHRAWCDGCSERIRGVRHKCLDCDDFDFCDACVGKEHFGGGHEFYALVEPGEVVVRNIQSDLPPVPSVRVRGLANAQIVRSQPSMPMSIPAPAPVPSHFPHRAGRTGRAAQPARHPAACDMCSSQILGVRYKCTNCPDYDVCESCFRISEEVHPGHSFVRVHKREDVVTRKTTQTRFRHHARCDVCQDQIMGVRYKCIHPACPDFDICARCEAMPIPVHPDTHALVKLRSHVSYYDGLSSLFAYASSRGQVRQRGQASPTVVPALTSLDAASVPVVRMPTPRVQIPSPRLQVPAIEPITSVEAFHTAAPSPVVPFSTLGTTIVPHTTIVASLPHTPTPEFVPTPTLSIPTIPSPPPIPPMLAQAHGIEKFFDSWSAASSSAKLDEHLMHHSDMYKPSYEAPSVVASVPEPIAVPVATTSESGSSMSAQIFREIRQRELEDKRARLSLLKAARDQRRRSQALSESESSSSVLASVSHPVTVDEEQDPDAPLMSLMASAQPVSIPNEPVVESVVDAAVAAAEVEAVREAIIESDEEMPAFLGEYRQPSPSLESVSDAATTSAIVVTPEQVETPQRIASPLPTAESEPELPPLEATYPSFHELSSFMSSTVTAERLAANLASVTVLSATFVEDKSIVDGQVVSGGAEFAKCWRMRNDGNTAWPQGTTISFVGGHSMLIEPDMVHWNVTGDLAAGNEIDVEVEMKAPEEPGRYVSYWRLKTPEGEAFGARIWCDIVVAELERAGSSGSSELSASSIVIPTHAPSMSAASVSPTMHSVPTTMHAESESEADTIDMESIGSLDSDDSAVWAEVRRQGMAGRSEGGDGFEVVYDSE
ncbi:hypothetical protein BDV93DRAFT_494889 [Ceratobasidium sp. AG-I]|nr:hypothetical protein BDV93DRAFT_494889 [Ceratobasidium sp. AG-I]